jgi:hypothetical protein
MVPAVEPVTEVVLDTPAGLVRLAVEVSGGVTGDVTLSNVPSFVAARDCSVVLPSTGQRVVVDIAFGGNFFAILPGEQLGFQVQARSAADDLPGPGASGRHQSGGPGAPPLSRTSTEWNWWSSTRRSPRRAHPHCVVFAEVP